MGDLHGLSGLLGINRLFLVFLWLVSLHNVTAHFIWQVDWAQGKTSFLAVTLKVFREGISIWVNDLHEEDLPSPTWGSTIPSAEGPNRTERMHSFSFFLSWDIHLLWPLGSGAPGSQATALGTHIRPADPFSCLWPWTGSYTQLTWFLGPLGRRLNYITGFPSFPVCNWPITELLSLHNWLSQCP